MALDSSSFACDPDLIEQFRAISRPVPCCRTRVLFSQGEAPEGLYILHRGAATLSTVSLGKEFRLLAQTTAGVLLGLPSLFSHEPYPLTAIVHGGSEVGFVDRDELLQRATSQPHLAAKILRVLAAEVNTVRQAILNQICFGEPVSDLAPPAQESRRGEACRTLPYVGWLPAGLMG